MSQAVTHRVSIYLAGGLRSGWQQRVISHCGSCSGRAHVFYDPRNLNPPRANYSLAEIARIERDLLSCADIVFAVAEAINPLPVGLAWELGWGRAHGACTILVDGREKPMAWLAHQCHETARDMEGGLAILSRLLDAWP